MKYKCNICGTVHNLNLGSLGAQARWDKSSEQDRIDIGIKLSKARQNKAKKLSTGQGK